MDITTESLMRLGLAIVLGGLIGAERESRDKSAGFRTMILICVGACLFTLASLQMGGPSMRDPARIAAQIVSGVGFLGAGVIMREGGRVMGITTASTIWLTAAIGMGIGGGFYVTSLAGAGAVLVILWLFPFVEHEIDRRADSRVYRVVCKTGCTLDEIAQILRDAGLRVLSSKLAKTSTGLTFFVEATGRTELHDKAALALVALDKVTEFST